MFQIETQPLLELSLAVDKPQMFGATPYGERHWIPVIDGSFEGPRLKVILLPGGGDAALVDADGVLRLDLRVTFQTDDGAFIYLRGNGVWRSDPTKPSQPEGRPAEYEDMYIMATQLFETGDERYKWLNDIVCVAEGKMNPVDEEGIMAEISWRAYTVLND